MGKHTQTDLASSERRERDIADVLGVGKSTMDRDQQALVPDGTPDVELLEEVAAESLRVQNTRALHTPARYAHIKGFPSVMGRVPDLHEQRAARAERAAHEHQERVRRARRGLNAIRFEQTITEHRQERRPSCGTTPIRRPLGRVRPGVKRTTRRASRSSGGEPPEEPAPSSERRSA